MDVFHQFLDQNMALLFFIYGLTFFMLGLVAALQYRPQSKIRLARNLWIIAIFGITHGLAEWGYVFIPLQAEVLTREGIVLVEIGHVALLVISFAFLLQFGLSVVSEEKAKSRRYILLLPAITYILWLIGLFSGVSLYHGAELHHFLIKSEAIGRYLFAIPGAILAGLAFFQQESELVGPVLSKGRTPARISAFAFFSYALLSGVFVPEANFFPANVVNTYAFHVVVNLPVQLFRAVAVVALAYFVFRLLETIEDDFACRLEWAECQQSVLNERLRISRDLHDGILQSVYALGLGCESIKHLVETNPAQAMEQIDNSIGSFNSLISEIREFIGTLRVETKDIKTLHAQVQEVVRDFRVRTDINTKVYLDELVEVKICPKQAEQIASIIKEALNNVSKHSGATQVTVDAQNGKRGLWIRVSDNGHGFRLPNSWRSKFSVTHQGINNMRERARLSGAEFEIRSKPGMGTAVSLYLTRDGLNQLCGGGFACGHAQFNSHIAS